MASQTKAFQFINSSGPGASERGTTYLVRSRAAIWAHSGRKQKRRVRQIHSSDASTVACACISDNTNDNDISGHIPDQDCSTCSRNAVLNSTTTIIMSKPSPKSLLDGGWQDPFGCLSLPCTPLENYMIDHYVRFLLPQFNIYSPDERSYSVFVQCMITRWVPFAFTDRGMMYGLLMLACRSLAALSKSVVFDQKALVYKARCIQCVKEALTSDEKRISDSNIWNVLSLASDEFHNGSIDAAKNHTKAIRDMTKMRGGLKALGLDGLLQQLVLWNDGTASFYTGKELTLTQDNPQITVPFAGYLAPGFKDHMSLFSPNMLSILSNLYITATLAHHHHNDPEKPDKETTTDIENIASRLFALSPSENHFSSPEAKASSQMEECLAFALLIYIKCCFPPNSTTTAPSYPALADLASRIRYLLAGALRVGSWGAAMSLPKRRTRGVWDLQLWMIFMAALGIQKSASVEEGIVDEEGIGVLRPDIQALDRDGLPLPNPRVDERWTVNAASALVKTLEIESQGEMERYLGTFLEIRGVLKVFAGEFWMAITMSSSFIDRS